MSAASSPLIRLCTNNCPAVGVWLPGVAVLSAAGEVLGGMSWPVIFCDKCKERVLAEDLITDSFWTNITAIMARGGKPAPDREQAFIQWFPVPEGLTAQ